MMRTLLATLFLTAAACETGVSLREDAPVATPPPSTTARVEAAAAPAELPKECDACEPRKGVCQDGMAVLVCMIASGNICPHRPRSASGTAHAYQRPPQDATCFCKGTGIRPVACKIEAR